MNLQEVFKKIEMALTPSQDAAPEVQEEVKVEMATMKLAGGVVVEAEAFEAGENVFLLGEDDEKVAAPVGEHELEDGKILVIVEEGVISEIREAGESEEVVEEEVNEVAEEESGPANSPLAGDELFNRFPIPAPILCIPWLRALPPGVWYPIVSMGDESEVGCTPDPHPCKNWPKARGPPGNSAFCSTAVKISSSAGLGGSTGAALPASGSTGGSYDSVSPFTVSDAVFPFTSSGGGSGFVTSSSCLISGGKNFVVVTLGISLGGGGGGGGGNSTFLGGAGLSNFITSAVTSVLFSAAAVNCFQKAANKRAPTKSAEPSNTDRFITLGYLVLRSKAPYSRFLFLKIISSKVASWLITCDIIFV